MASTIAALTTGGGGIATSADASGNLSLLSGATTVVAVTATGATVTGTLAATGAVSGTTGTFTGAVGTAATGGLNLPSGTTAQRPTGVDGMQRFNSTTTTGEVYNNGGWNPLNTNVVTDYQQFNTSGTFTVPAGVRVVQVLLVGGGGGGGNGGGGGGGGGVLFIPNYKVTPAGSITVTVGTGGAINTNGLNSQWDVHQVAFGGGAGGLNTDVSFGNVNGPKQGASGGGGSATSTVIGSPAPGSSQGSAGGIAPNVAPFPGGGGGGANGCGGSGSGGTDGAGGTGLYFQMFAAYGQSGSFGGGGGGGYLNTGVAGLGGGGASRTAGTANTGGGGGGGQGANGGAGGSGTVIVAWYQ